jgi:hypothetical protein
MLFQVRPSLSRRIFQGEKFLSTPSFGWEVKPSCPMSQDLPHVKDPYDVAWKSASSAKTTGKFSPTKFHLSLLGALASCYVEAPGGGNSSGHAISVAVMSQWTLEHRVFAYDSFVKSGETIIETQQLFRCRFMGTF